MNLVIRRVMLSQLLFTAGNSLTTGGFLYYFAARFSPSNFWLAALMIAPETAQSLSVVGRWLAIRYQNRKHIWVCFLICGRGAALLIPLALFWNPAEQNPSAIVFILGCTLVWYLCQGIAFVNYISWLSDLLPEREWGRLFSRRQLAGLSLSIFLPLGVAFFRSHYLKQLPASAESRSYAVIFLIGGCITMASILPLLRFPEVHWTRPKAFRFGEFWEEIRINRSFQWLLATRWWLAFFQGLTQAVLFGYATKVLQLSLTSYLVLTSVMLAMQLPFTWWAGRVCDAYREKQALFWGLIGVSLAMPFWMAADAPGWWLVVFPYLIWGGFGMINVCGQNLCLKLSPDSDNAGQFALYDQVAGLIAGIAGLIGGWWLDQLQETATGSGLLQHHAYALLFGISWLGRFTAAFWLLPIDQPRRVHQLESESIETPVTMG